MNMMNCICCGLNDLESLKSINNLIQIVELRLDLGFSQEKLNDLNKLISNLRKNGLEIIATCRRTRDGGEFRGLEEERIDLLKSVIDMGATIVDLEFESGAEKLSKYASKKCKIIFSYHNFQSIPENLVSIAERMSEKSSWAYKIVCRINKYNENIMLLNLNKYFTSKGLNGICFGLGDKSHFSRAFLRPYGGKIQFYGSTNQKTAPGQFSVADIESYHLDYVNDTTNCFGVIGNPVSHSSSPLIHNFLFDKYKINSIFLPFYVDDLIEFIDFAEKVGISGFAVTYPYKSVKFYKERFRLENDVKRFSSGNTVFKYGNNYSLTDTDYEGFSRFFENRIRLKKGRAVIIGTGNTAYKIATFLNSIKWKVTMISRNPEIIRKSTDKICEIAGYNQLPSLSFNVLINTTPAGSFSNEEWKKILSGINVQSDSIIIDINYGRNALPFIGCSNFDLNKKYDGLEMLVEQAALQFKIWTDIMITQDEKRQIIKNLECDY